MAQTLTLASGGVQIVPGSSININVANSPSGTAVSGIVAIVGEAEEGPSWTQDLSNGVKLSSNVYGLGDIAAVQAKYGSGRIVDAYLGLLSPSASPAISGGPNQIIIVKTNNSSQASLTTPDQNGKFLAKLGGLLGNQIQASVVTSTPEQAPTSGQFTYIPSSSAASMISSVNGGSQAGTYSIGANTSPTSLAEQLVSEGAGLNVVGGVNRSVLSGLSGQNISLTVVSGRQVTINLASPNVFATAPQIGDSLNIPSGSVLAGAGNANVGWYVVTGITNVSGNAFLNATAAAGTPVNVSATPISGTPDDDLIDYSYMQINNMTGKDRQILSGLVGQNITVTVSGSKLTATLAIGQKFNGLPSVGDSLFIGSASAYAGAGSANVGWYQVTLVSNTASSAFIQMSRLSNGSPVAVSATPIASVDDLLDYDPQIPGVGKAMELYDNSGAVNIDTLFYNLGTFTAASWIGKLLLSSAELKKTVNVVRTSTSSSESFTVGGDIAFTLGYDGTSASCTVQKTSGVLMLTTNVSGGSGANLSINLSLVATLSDLVSLINANTGYSAAVGTTAAGLQNPSVLDETTFNINSTLGFQPGRLKMDQYELTAAQGGISGSALVSYSPIATAGLPDDFSSLFLSGGTRGGTSGLQFSQAVDALQSVRCNFVVPLVSQDASLDIAIGDTDPSSTYMVDAVNAAVKSHVLAMSTPQVKRHRLGIVSKRDTFSNDQAAAQQLSTARVAVTFLDVFNLNSQGAIEQFQPWMGSITAAAMQAAGSYKSIFNKSLNISGIIQAAGDYDDLNTSQTEQALLAGLMPLQQLQTGGYAFVSDQTTYSLDNNFVYNSLQAMYVADIMALDLAQSLQTAYVGASTADVTAASVTSFVKSKLTQYLGLKYIASTAQYPAGWVSINVNITAPVMSVSVTAIEATSLYFIPINLNIQGVQASGGASA